MTSVLLIQGQLDLGGFDKFIYLSPVGDQRVFSTSLRQLSGVSFRVGRDWDSGRKIDGDRTWQTGRDGGIPGQSHIGARGGMAG